MSSLKAGDAILFKRNEIFKFSMVTNPEGVPDGTALAAKKTSDTKEE